MKRIILQIALLLNIIVVTTINSSFVTETITIAPFKQTAKELLSLKTITYHYTREFNYPSEDYISKAEGEMFVDFKKENDLAGFRYQYSSNNGKSIFNNAELFDLNEKQKTINVKHQVKPADLEGKSALYNSIITLRNALPLIINDSSIIKTVKDTVINNRNYNLLQFRLHNKLINYVGTNFTPTTGDLTFVYKIITDKKTSLPLTVLQTRVGSADLNRTDFSDVKTNPVAIAEKSWYYSSYLNSYTLSIPGKPLTLIKSGEAAPDWALTNYATGNTEKLSDYKGKLVLLEFWIKNCGHCIEAVPGLNNLTDQYGKHGLSILALNTEDSKTSIATFYSKHLIKYNVLFGNDASVNKNYGVAAFPQIVLIDKTGLVIYSGNFDVEKLKQLIKANLI